MKPTPKELSARIFYDPATGALTWRAYPDPVAWQISWNERCAGKVAFGNLSKRGYLVGTWKPYTLTAHRVAWAIYHGEWPEGQIDHINGDRTDNRIANLRDVPNSINAKNMSLSAANKSGTTGVFWAKHVGKWTAQIVVDGKAKHLGLFADKDDAIAARMAAQMQYGFHENHGTPTP